MHLATLENRVFLQRFIYNFTLSKTNFSIMLTALNTLSVTLQAFKEFTDEPDVQIQTFETFLIVAIVKNPSMNDIAQRIGLTQPAASRNIKKLCEAPRGQEGYGLITMQLDPVDHRRRLIGL